MRILRIQKEISGSLLVLQESPGTVVLFCGMQIRLQNRNLRSPLRSTNIWIIHSTILVDPGGDPDVAATIAGILEGGGYKVPTDASSNSLTSISKARAVGALGRVEIKQIDADGRPIETWTLWNAWVEDVDFGGTLSYGDEKLTEIALKLKYDWARIETKAGSAAEVLGGDAFFNV